MTARMMCVVIGLVFITGFIRAQSNESVPEQKRYATVVHEKGLSIIRIGAGGSILTPYEKPVQKDVRFHPASRPHRTLKNNTPPQRSSISSAAVIYTVTDPGDAPDEDLSDEIFSPQTLRAAIQNANKTEAADAIIFDPGVQTVALTSQLPHIYTPVIIEGSSGDYRTVIDGTLSSGSSLMTVHQDSEISGLVFQNSAGKGLGLTVGGGNNKIYDCVFANNKGPGINVNSDYNVIGWTEQGLRNYCIGNLYNTVTFASAYGIAVVLGNHNQIYGNFVGTMDGATSQPNESGGIYVDGNYNDISGNLVSGNYWAGLDLDGFASLVEANVIGLNFMKTDVLPNGGAGIYSRSSNDTIIGNVVAGNYGQGVSIGSEFSVNNVVTDNYIGCDESMTLLAGNGGTGISTRGPGTKIQQNTVVQNWIGIELLYKGNGCVVQNNSIGVIEGHPQWTGNLHEGLIISSKDNIIGGALDSANVIADNGWTGILMIGGTIFSFGGQTPNIVSGNVISYNSIGINTSGTKSPNKYGIELMGHIQDNLITENEILSHTAHGVVFRKFSSGLPSGNTLTHNHIGTNRSGLIAYGNDSAGIYIEDARNNMIGGTGENDGNIISHNKGGGIIVAGGKGISILGNAINNNDGLGIDLGMDGPTLSDSYDMDTGPNGLANPPILHWSGWDESTYIISGVMHGGANTQYRLEFFENFTPDTSGFGEGFKFLGTKSVTTDANGNAPFQFTFLNDAPPRHVTATATGPDSSTSEFAKAPLVVNSAADRPDADPNDGVPWTNGPLVFGLPEVTLRSAIQASNHIAGYDWITFNIPGAAPQLISPASEYETMLEQVSINGSFQPGYVAPEPSIIVSGVNAGASVTGLSFVSQGINIRGLHIHSFDHYGIYGGTGTMTIADCIVASNRKGGAYTAGSFSLEGTNRFNINGKNDGECQDSTAFGLYAEENLTGSGTVEASGNCGDGIANGIFGDLFSFSGSITANGNGMYGMRANNGMQLYDGPIEANGNGWFGIGAVTGNIVFNSLAARTEELKNAAGTFSLTVNDNRQSGIVAASGDIFLSAPAQVNGNRAGKTDQQAINDGNAGIWAFGNAEVNGLEAVNNGLYGIAAKNITLQGSGTVAQHIAAGISALEDIETGIGDWLFEQNGIHGVFAGGSFNAQGITRAVNNGWYESPPSISSGAIHAGDFVAVDYLVANGNENGSGVYAGKGVWVRGTAEVRSNDFAGIFSDAYIQIDYGPSYITGNGSWGLVAPFGQIIAYDPLFVLSNGLKGCGASLPAEAGGIGAASVSLVDATILGNCGPGIWAFHSLNVNGTALIDSNSGSGILSRGKVTIGGGRISANQQWGIVAPVVRLGPVSIASNAAGGLLGEPASLSSGTGFAKFSPDTAVTSNYGASTMNGGEVINNGGDGIRYKYHLPLTIQHTNISGNTGSGINAAGSGPVTANDNWWGSVSGPGTSVSGPVTAVVWRTSPVGLSVRPAADTVYLKKSQDTLRLIAAQWNVPYDSAVVAITQMSDWIEGPETLTVVIRDRVPVTMKLPISVPSEISAGASNIMTVHSRSLIEPDRKDSASVVLVRYEPALFRVAVNVDTVTLSPGDSVQFGAIGFDQAGHTLPLNALWSASGGAISSNGMYTAGIDTGSFAVTATDSSTGIQGTATVRIVSTLLHTAESEQIPGIFLLEQNYPNPFNPTTTMRYGIPEQSIVRLGIYNILGQRVHEEAVSVRSAGWHTFQWTPQGSTGMYIVRLEAIPATKPGQRTVLTRKILYLK